MPRSRLDRAELKTWVTLIGGIRSLMNALDRQLRDEQGMSHDDYQILAELYRARHPMRMSDLAGVLGFSRSRLSHAFARLETEGWVTRARDDGDRRVISATLTDSGVERVQEASVSHLAQVERLVFETLGAERASQMARAMAEVGKAARGER